jgi:hypothetical protein
VRRPALDAQYAGYQVYSVQDDPLDRHVTALFLQSRNTAGVFAGIAYSGGPRNVVFQGGYYQRTGAYSAPDVPAGPDGGADRGLVTYAGNYVGLTNIDGLGGDLLPVDPGTAPNLVPSQSAHVTGRAVLLADFADNRVEGNVYDRNIYSAGLLAAYGTYPTRIPDLVLIATDLATDGSFAGDIEYDLIQPGINPATGERYEATVRTVIGGYGGILSGVNATSAAVVVNLTEWDGESNQLGYRNELERGVFVIEQCGSPDENSPVCSQVDPQ